MTVNIRTMLSDEASLGANYFTTRFKYTRHVFVTLLKSPCLAFIWIWKMTYMVGLLINASVMKGLEAWKS